MHSQMTPAPDLSARIAALLALTLTLTFGVAVSAAEPPARSSLRYDFDYPDLNYTTAPVDNRISRLQRKLDSGEVKLQRHPVRGYLDSLLHELRIDPSSQVLIYSKTSLQTELIDVGTPRAIYFNDDTYIGFVHNTHFIEITTVDPKLGVLFYGLVTDEKKPPQFSREAGRCLSCHDTYSMLGGGTPRIVVTSAPVLRLDGKSPSETSSLSTDRTPFEERWGGWYVTGNTGAMKHLGNLPLDDPRPKVGPLAAAPRNISSVAGLFDTSSYLTDRSDVVALLVLEHQANVQTLMTRATYKARTALKRVTGSTAEPASWAELPPTLQKSFIPLLESVSQALLMEGVVDLAEPVVGSSGYDLWFSKQGPRDAQGRSLRDLDLRDRVFRYPLSYLLYSEGFDGLPQYMRDYIYTRIEKAAADDVDDVASRGRRREAAEILAATKPEFANHWRAASAQPAVSANR